MVSQQVSTVSICVFCSILPLRHVKVEPLLHIPYTSPPSSLFPPRLNYMLPKPHVQRGVVFVSEGLSLASFYSFTSIRQKARVSLGSHFGDANIALKMAAPSMKLSKGHTES